MKEILLEKQERVLLEKRERIKIRSCQEKTGRQELSKKSQKYDLQDMIDRLDRLAAKVEDAITFIQGLKGSLLDRGNKWVDGRKAMKILRVSARTLQRMRSGGMLAFSRIGGKLYYKAEDLEELLSRNYSSLKTGTGGTE